VNNQTDDEREAQHQKELKQLAEYWREQLEIETGKVLKIKTLLLFF